TLVKDIEPGSGGSGPDNLVNLNGVLCFIASQDGRYSDLWRRDGTDAGTTKFGGFQAGPSTAFLGGSSLSGLTAVGGTLFFDCSSAFIEPEFPPSYSNELFKSDGTSSGTVLVKSFSDAAPSNVTAVRGTLFFAAADGGSGSELWKSDGTPDGTALVK